MRVLGSGINFERGWVWQDEPGSVRWRQSISWPEIGIWTELVGNILPQSHRLIEELLNTQDRQLSAIIGGNTWWIRQPPLPKWVTSRNPKAVVDSCVALMMIAHDGHTKAVFSVAFSPDGKSVVSGSDDNTVRTWDAQRSSPMGEPLRGHGSTVRSVSYSPLGNLIASGSKDKTIRLWDPSTGQQSGKVLTGDYWFLSVAFSPDAKLIASGCGGYSSSSTRWAVQLWDVQTRKAASRRFKGHTNDVQSVSFSPDGTRLVSGSDDKTIRVWDVERKLPILGPLEGHTDWVRSVAFSPDSAQIVSCSIDRTIRLWDPRTGQPIGNPYTGHTNAVSSVSFSPRGTYIASGSWDKTVRLWDVRTGRQVEQPFKEHANRVTSVAFSPCGQFISSGSDDRKVIIRRVLGEDEYPAAGDIEPQEVTSQMEVREDNDLDGDVEPQIVTSQMSTQQIFDFLCRAGCIDLSLQMDARQETARIVSGGGFGDIWKGEMHTGVKVAIKAWRTYALGPWEHKTLKHIARELYLQSRMEHPHINRLQGITLFRDQHLGMVSEWMDNGNLHDYLLKHPDADRYQLCIHVASGLEYMHSRSMVHGDLKALNVLVSSDGIAKLSGFDLSVMSDASSPASSSTRVGSIRWAAPEMLTDEVPHKTTQSDVYALGMTMLEIHTGDVPYTERRVDSMVLMAVMRGTLPIRPVHHIKDDEHGNRVWKLLSDCWNRDPSNRPSAGQVLQVLEEAREDPESDNDVEPQIVDTMSLIRGVLNSSVSPSAESVVAPGVPFLGLETGLKTLSNLGVKKEAIAIQSQSIEAELPGLKEDLTDRQDANTSRIRPILQVGQNLKKDALDLELQMRETNDPESDFIDRANEILNEVEELLQLIHMPNARADSSHRPLLDMSLSVLAKLASSLFSMSTSSNMNSIEYFRLSKRNLMIATYYLPKAHSAKPIIASHWGTLYLLRFQLFGKNDHITQAIKFYEQSLKDLPVDYPQRAMFLASLGRSYLARFDDSQLADDLKNGIEYSSQAWKAIESDEGATPGEKKHIFEGTSRGLQCLIEHVGGSNSISLINTGIREWGNALGEVLKNEKSKGDLKADCMRILGFLYSTRFDQAGSQNPVDLERSTAFLAAAVALLPKKHSDLLSTLCVLAHSLAAKARDEAGRELALEFLKLVETLTTPAFEPHLLCSFGDLYVSLSRRADLSHLKLAVEYYDRALKHPNCPPGSRLWAKVRQNLGTCGIYCYNILNTQRSPLAIEHLESALRQFIHVTLSPKGHLFDRFTAACSWATNAASHPAFRAQSLYGYETAMELIPLLVSFGAVPDQRRKATQKSGQLATEAAATAIKEKKYSTALALLEQGRSVKWNHMLQLQSPLYMLKLHPDGEVPAKQLEELLKGLQLGAETNASADPAGQPSLKLDGLDLQARYQQVLETIRNIKGFANFMRPKPVSELLKAARNGPVVVINVHQSSCDALVVPQFDHEHSPQPQNIPLPELRLRRITEMREAIDQSLARISNSRRSNSESDREEEKRQGTEQLKAGLKNLWYWVVDPILTGLRYQPRSADDLDPNKLPRITWCATGPLSFLPLHAAGDYDYPSRNTFEYVVSSYTPTLSALVPDPHHDVSPKHPCHILLVNPESSSGEDALPAAGAELDCIVYHYKMATGSLGRRFRIADNIELDWSWDGAPKESNDSQAHINSELSLDMDGVSDDELDPDWKIKLPTSSKSAKTPQSQGKAARYTRLDGRDASPEKVYNEMQNHDWVHFACHAVQNNGDPSKCGFSLRGKLLSLQTIARMPYEKRGLAFLSACRTAAGDQNLPDEAIHLASGMLMTGYSRVIATLWPVKDADAPFVANIVYKRLLVDEGMKCDDSAVALHVALDRLRKEPRVGLPDWISFVHFGAC